MQLLSTKEVCSKLKISLDTLHRWRKNDNINFPKPVKLLGNNGKTLWIESDIEDFIKNNKS